MTKVYLDNYNKFGGDTYTIFDQDSPVYIPQTSELTREISDHMKIGTYTFSLLPQHPAYDHVELKRSVVRVVNDQQTVFRGDVVKISTDKYGIKKITCQTDMKWLVDIPDIFSRFVPAETTYNIGSENARGRFWFKDSHHPYNDQTVYISEPRDVTETQKYEWEDFKFRPQHFGRKYTVEILKSDEGEQINVTYELPLLRHIIPRDNFPITVLYLGNIHMARPTGGFDPATVTIPSTIDVPIADTPTDAVTVVPEGQQSETIPQGDLDWCIIHYYDPLKDDITASNYGYGGRNESYIFTTISPPSQGIPVLYWRCSYTSKTHVSTMVNSVFCTDDAQTITGYNRLVSPNRRIYRGNIKVDGELENSNVETIYSNLNKWLDVTGGYASIRYSANGNAYLDLLPKSGDEDDSITVKFGENVSDYGKSEDVLSLYTGIFIKGKSIKKTEEGQEVDNSLTLAGKTIASQLPGFVFDSGTGIIYHAEARRKYGDIILFFETEIDQIPESEQRALQIQYLYDKGCGELRTRLEAFTSFDISAHDTRLIGATGASPVLGNYYLTDIPLWGEPTYKPLTKIVENHLKPSANKLTFGDKKQVLIDYVAKEKRA